MSTAEAPAYRKKSGRDQAVVTLTDRRSGLRRDFPLGSYGSPESRELYHRLLAQ